MSDLYKRIEDLCRNRGTNITEMCRESGASRGSLTDLKMGRTSELTARTLAKISEYLNVSIDYLVGNAEKSPASQVKRGMSDEELMFALWGDTTDIDEDDLADVRRYAEFVRERKRQK